MRRSKLRTEPNILIDRLNPRGLRRLPPSPPPQRRLGASLRSRALRTSATAQ